MICEICKSNFETIKSLSQHIISFHKMLVKDYYDKYIKHENDGICSNINCNNKTKFYGLSKGYAKYCSAKCNRTSIETQEKYKQTSLLHYNIDNPAKSDIVQEKIKNTNTKKYGNIYAIASDIVKEKIKNTNNIKHNCDYPLQNPDILNKCHNTVKLKYNTNNFTKTNEYKNQYHSNWISNWQYQYKDGVILERIDDKVKCFCNICKTEFTITRQLFIERIGIYNINPCINCIPYNRQKSRYEDEIYDYISSIYNGPIERNNRTILNGKEIDIYLPEKKIGFEFDGTYWHADPRFYNPDDIIKSKQAHIIWTNDENKELLAEQSGIKLIRINEYDWVNNSLTEYMKINNIIKKSN